MKPHKDIDMCKFFALTFFLISFASAEYCDKPLGTVAVAEPQDYMILALGKYNLQSPTGLIRFMIQESNCFVVVERGPGMNNILQERDLRRPKSDLIVTAEYVLTASIVFSEKNAGGIGGALGGLIGNRAIGAVLGGLKFKEAQTSMLLSDISTGLQVASAEGSARKADIGFGVLVGGAALGGYGNTSEGKIIAASLAENYNGIVQAIRNLPKREADFYREGDILRPKISNIKVYALPDISSDIIKTLREGEGVIYMGEKQNGFLRIETGDGGGWVKELFIR